MKTPMTAAEKKAARNAARRRYNAECRARAQATAGLGVLPAPTAEQRAKADPASDPTVQAILREWYGA